MKKLLAPDRLSSDPGSSAAEKEYIHWKKTFDYFMEDALLSTDEDEEEPDEEQENYFKLRCLTKYVSASIYEYFSDCENYKDAITVLDKLYLKKKNEIFQRHLLAKR